MFNYYYNQSIRKLVIAFGSLFNNMKVKQLNKDGSERTITVPLTYAPKEKFIKRITEFSSISEQTRIQIGIPLLSFEMSGIAYDATRKFNKLNKRTANMCGETGAYSYAEAPYNFGFNLYCYSRNIDENLEIMEQILPQFSPEFIVSLNFTSLHQKIDVPITLASVQLTEEHEGDFNTRRLVIGTYQFIAKSYVFGEVRTAYPINEIQGFALNIGDGFTLGTFGITG